jgi:hypothetical protein
MKLSECITLVNIEGEVYKLSDKNFQWFKDQVYSQHQFNALDWSELLHWAQEHGKKICEVESFNF